MIATTSLLPTGTGTTGTGTGIAAQPAVVLRSRNSYECFLVWEFQLSTGSMAGPDQQQHQIAECLNRAITLVRLYAIQDTYMYHVVVMTPILLDVNEMSHLNRQNGSGASRNQLLKAYTQSDTDIQQ